MSENRLDKDPSKRSKKIRRHGAVPGVFRNVLTRAIRPTGPLVIVCLAGALLSCNFIWLYSTRSSVTKGPCSNEATIWGSLSSAFQSSLDYQRVHGSGLRDVPDPIPIPNDTVLVGASPGSSPGGEFGPDGGRDRRRFVTIGIPSVWRKDNYLHLTLDSIFKETSEEEKLDIYVYILLADADPQKRIDRAKAIEERYKEFVDNGMIQVLQPPNALYPSIDFSKIRRTYNDKVERVQWRTKQVLDFVFLFWYTWTNQPSTYYLVLEDDVLSANHFVSATKDFVQLHEQHHWISLQLTGFLGIGQLLRCEDLDQLVAFLLLFYKEHPVDILISHWVNLMAPEKPPKDRPVRRVPGLFQHVGVHSTLANKIQTLRDDTFSLVKRRFSHVNPSADVVTSIRQYKSFVAELAYSSAPGMFWGSPKPKDTYDIIFSQPLQLYRLYISTGTTVHNKRKTTILRDRLSYGHVEVSSCFEKMETPQKASCKNFEFLRAFEKGKVDYLGFPELFPEGIQCIRVVVDDFQKTWVAISEIAVFTMDEIDLNATQMADNGNDKATLKGELNNLVKEDKNMSKLKEKLRSKLFNKSKGSLHQQTQ